MHHVEISPRALADIEEAFLFIRKEAPTRAEAWLQGMIAAIHSLEKMPNRCAKAPESQELGMEIRQLLYGKRPGVYRVLFLLAGGWFGFYTSGTAPARAFKPVNLKGWRGRNPATLSIP
ncbi:type II toxin-antitoxin system RelE/ParE family toxin [Methylomagnum sp.]